MPVMRLELPGLIGWAVRPWRSGDESDLVRHADNPAVARNLKDRFPSPYTRNDAREWISLCLKQTPATNFAITWNDAPAGGIGLTPGTDIFRRSAELGYWLGEPFWGRGVATAAVRAVTTWAFASLDLARIHAGVLEWNPASRRVLEKAGYVLEARLRRHVTKEGRTMDEFLYAKVREE